MAPCPAAPNLALSEQARRFAALAGGGKPDTLSSLSARLVEQAHADLRAVDRHIGRVQQEQAVAKRSLDERIKRGTYSVDEIRQMQHANDVYSEDILGLIDRRHIAVERLQKALKSSKPPPTPPNSPNRLVEVANAVAKLSYELENRVNGAKSVEWRLHDAVERRRRLEPVIPAVNPR